MSSLMIDRPSAFSRLGMQYAARFWFTVALAGQWLFVVYLLMAFGLRVVTGDFAAINETGLITGYVAGDTSGNLVMFSHLLIAAIVSFGGLLQLVPRLRARFPWFHRWNGRLFLTAALVAAVSGLYLTWVRGSRLSDISAISVSLNGLLLLVAGGYAWRLARAKRFAEHRRWAIRTFLLASGVWMFRLMLMGWFMANQGLNGNTQNLDGPADITIAFGSYLIPLVIAELYFWAERRQEAIAKALVASVLGVATVLMGFGIFAAFMMLWWPHLG